MAELVYVAHPHVVFAQVENTFTRSATRWTFDADG
jgi:hypothetical protein